MNSPEKISYKDDSINWEEILESFILISNNYDHLKTIFQNRSFKMHDWLYKCVDWDWCKWFCSLLNQKSNPAICSKWNECNNFERAFRYTNEFNLNTSIEKIIQTDWM